MQSYQYKPSNLISNALEVDSIRYKVELFDIEVFQEPKRAQRIRTNQNIQKKTERLLKLKQGYEYKFYQNSSINWKDSKGVNKSGFCDQENFNEWIAVKARKERNNRTVCSCWMCGNPRFWFKDKTRQESVKNLPDLVKKIEKYL